VTKIITAHLTLANFFLLAISLIFAQSCVTGFGILVPTDYYKPLNEGKRIGGPAVSGANYILLLDIYNGVIARTGLYFTPDMPTPLSRGYLEPPAGYSDTKLSKFDPQNFLSVSVVIIVPRELTVRLASDKVEIYSPELDSPITGRVKSIKEMKGQRTETEYLGMATLKTNDVWTEVPPLGTYDELYGYKVKEPSFYLLVIEYINKNPVPEKPPENVTVFLPELYINDELHKIEPLRFKSTWTVIHSY